MRFEQFSEAEKYDKRSPPPPPLSDPEFIPDITAGPIRNTVNKGLHNYAVKLAKARLAKMPFQPDGSEIERRYAEKYGTGSLFNVSPQELETRFKDIVDSMRAEKLAYNFAYNTYKRMGRDRADYYAGNSAALPRNKTDWKKWISHEAEKILGEQLKELQKTSKSKPKTRPRKGSKTSPETPTGNPEQAPVEATAQQIKTIWSAMLASYDPFFDAFAEAAQNSTVFANTNDKIDQDPNLVNATKLVADKISYDILFAIPKTLRGLVNAGDIEARRTQYAPPQAPNTPNYLDGEDPNQPPTELSESLINTVSHMTTKQKMRLLSELKESLRKQK